MSDAARRLATYEDLLALPEDVRAEILAGQVVTAPAPLPKHSKAQGALRRFVGGPFDDDDGRGGPGGWWIFVEVDIALGPHEIVRPDLALAAGMTHAEILAEWTELEEDDIRQALADCDDTAVGSTPG